MFSLAKQILHQENRKNLFIKIYSNELYDISFEFLSFYSYFLGFFP